MQRRFLPSTVASIAAFSLILGSIAWADADQNAEFKLLRPTQATHKPNIVLFFVDDFGQKDLSCYGSSLYETLQMHAERTGESFRLNKFERPTSVENLAFKLFTEITELGFKLAKIEVRETETSVLLYTRQDWIEDGRRFAATDENVE